MRPAVESHSNHLGGHPDAQYPGWIGRPQWKAHATGRDSTGADPLRRDRTVPDLPPGAHGQTAKI